MDRDDLAIIEAARAQDVNVHKGVDGMWNVGLSTVPDPVTVSNLRQVDTMLSGGIIRLANGRTLKAEMTEAEAREEFGLDAAHQGPPVS